MSARFGRRFAGRDNAGLREMIRNAAGGVACGPEAARRVAALAGTVALTAAGRSTLAQVADDYRAGRAAYRPQCDCDACYAGHLQSLGAFG